jgi:integrase
MKTLTDAAVRKEKPTDRRREIRDALGRGLYLVVQPSGAKSWAVRFRRPDGRAGKLTLGTFDDSKTEAADEPRIGAPLSLSAARQLANTIARQRKTGVDPIVAEKRKREEARVKNGQTFGAVARDFVREHRTKQGELPRGWRSAARVLGLDYPLRGDPRSDAPTERPGGLARRWADKPIGDVTSHDIRALVEEARRRGVPGVIVRSDGTSETRGRLVFSVVSTLFKWAARRGRVLANPCAGVWAPGPGKSGERVLTAAEVRALWRACDDVGGPYGSAVKLLLLTGCRLREIAELRWDEVAQGGAEVHLPSGRTKNHRPHLVFLAPAAQAILGDVPRIAGCPHVFTSTGRGPLTGWSQFKSRLDESVKLAPWKLHDLRRTVVTGLVELGVPPHVVELIVNHVSGTRGGVAGVYNRSEMRAERKAAADRWANHVLAVVSGSADNVVSLRS